MWHSCTQATFRTSKHKSVRGNKPTCTAHLLAVAALCKSGKAESQFAPKHGMKTHRNTGGTAPRIRYIGIPWN